jgi:molecular chaperone HscC
MTMTMRVVGIDLGTTNSAVAVWEDQSARVIPNALGQLLTPSVVGVDDDGSVLVGAAARERLRTHPHATAAAFKRVMGTERLTTLAGRAFRPEDLSSLVLRALKADAEAALGGPIDAAVISVPAYFNDTQRRATLAAARLADIKVDRLINEPTAAALAYGLHERRADGTFLVFDLGGGTFDVSILEMFEGVMEVHACAGDNYLGGEDFVDVICALAFERSGIERSSLDARQHHRLRALAERTKCQLSAAESALLPLPDGASIEISRADFEAAAEPLLARLRGPCERALRDAKLRTSSLDAVVLVGGATRMPAVRSLTARLFGRMPTLYIDPDCAIALGAAAQCALNARDAALRDVVMTDVTPYSLGVQIIDESGRDVFLPIIERNTTVPVSRVASLQPAADNQRQLRLQVYQGESRRPKDNVRLGEMIVHPPRGPRHEASFDVRFTYDASGVLEIDVVHDKTGDTARLVITLADVSLTTEDIERRLAGLADLKLSPRDRAENRAFLARAERIYEESLGEVRAYVAELMTAFERTLDQQDPAAIAAARAALTDELDHVEGALTWD